MSNLGGNIGEIRKLQGKMPYSEGGPSNGWISKRLIDIGLKRSGSIPIRQGYRPV